MTDFSHETRQIGIGHNSGENLGQGFKRYAWKKARTDLLKNKVPIEIVRLRVRRAKEIGLSYPQYASILLGSGRDITAFLFTVDGLQLRLRKQLEMPDNVQKKLQGLEECDLLSFAPSGEDSEAFRLELQDVAGVPFVNTHAEPEPSVSWSQARTAISAALEPIKLPGNAVVMVGTREAEAKWAVAGKIAKFIPSAEYFPADGVV